MGSSSTRRPQDCSSRLNPEPDPRASCSRPSRVTGKAAAAQRPPTLSWTGPPLAANRARSHGRSLRANPPPLKLGPARAARGLAHGLGLTTVQSSICLRRAEGAQGAGGDAVESPRGRGGGGGQSSCPHRENDAPALDAPERPAGMETRSRPKSCRQRPRHVSQLLRPHLPTPPVSLEGPPFSSHPETTIPPALPPSSPRDERAPPGRRLRPSSAESSGSGVWGRLRQTAKLYPPTHLAQGPLATQLDPGDPAWQQGDQTTEVAKCTIPTTMTSRERCTGILSFGPDGVEIMPDISWL